MKNFFKKLFCSDSMSKHFSETVQRVGKNNAGFSLVELIVVIAIMAILAAVAVIGVSVYIPKAQKQADMTLVDDLSDGIVMVGAGADWNGATGNVGYVLITDNGLAVYDGSLTQITTYGVNPVYDAVVDVMGAEIFTKDNLAYGKWLDGVGDVSSLVGSYTGSSFDGNMENLLGDIQNLTNAVENIGASTVFDNDTEFKAYIDGLEGVDLTNDQVIANYATIYVADSMAGLDDTARNNFANVWANSNAQVADFISVTDENGKEVLSNIGIAAAYYARGEAIAAYLSSNPTANAMFFDNMEAVRATMTPDDLAASGVYVTPSTSVSAWFAALPIGGNSIDDVKSNLSMAGTMLSMFAASIPAYNDYFSGTTAKTDALAYIDSLTIVHQNKDQLTNNMGSDNLYNDGVASSFFNTQVAFGSLLSGQSNAIMITVKRTADGNIECSCYPNAN